MKPKVGHIKFLNCLPLYFALEAQGKLALMELISGQPTELNEKLIAGELDISPISSIEYAKHPSDLLLLPDISISSNGPVKSILLVSKVEIEKLGNEKVAITTASATSRLLLEIILRERYGLDADLFPSPLSLSEMLKTAAAALLIGDEALRALLANDGYHLYDLGREWKEMTGEAMVYAVWVARKDYARTQTEDLHKVHKAILGSINYSLERIDDISTAGAKLSGFDPGFLKDYFTTLRFGFGEEYRRGLEIFFIKAKEHGFLKDDVELNFI